MKTLLLTLCLALGSCAGVPLDLVPTDGAIGRQVARVVARHDEYVRADLELSSLDRGEALAQSAALGALLILPAAGRPVLRAAYEPVAVRHDAYVRGDPSLDELAAQTYLASSDQLRRLLSPPE